jgi:hypothetical protein
VGACIPRYVPRDSVEGCLAASPFSINTTCSSRESLSGHSSEARICRKGQSSKRRALVLGAGGYAAMAWETGFILGSSDATVDLRNADLTIGTSAGARVAAQIQQSEAARHALDVNKDARMR